VITSNDHEIVNLNGKCLNVSGETFDEWLDKISQSFVIDDYDTSVFSFNLMIVNSPLKIRLRLVKIAYYSGTNTVSMRRDDVFEFIPQHQCSDDSQVVITDKMIVNGKRRRILATSKDLDEGIWESDTRVPRIFMKYMIEPGFKYYSIEYQK